jgi:hypothetical protein
MMDYEDPRHEPVSLWDDFKELKWPLAAILIFGGFIASVLLIILSIALRF